MMGRKIVVYEFYAPQAQCLLLEEKVGRRTAARMRCSPEGALQCNEFAEMLTQNGTFYCTPHQSKIKDF